MTAAEVAQLRRERATQLMLGTKAQKKADQHRALAAALTVAIDAIDPPTEVSS
jgi:hypothetical protein